MSSPQVEVTAAFLTPKLIEARRHMFELMSAPDEDECSVRLAKFSGEQDGYSVWLLAIELVRVGLYFEHEGRNTGCRHPDVEWLEGQLAAVDEDESYKAGVRDACQFGYLVTHHEYVASMAIYREARDSDMERHATMITQLVLEARNSREQALALFGRCSWGRYDVSAN